MDPQCRVSHGAVPHCARTAWLGEALEAQPAIVSCTPVHLIDELPRPATVKSHLKSFSMADGVHDARALLLAGQWDPRRRQQGQQPPEVYGTEVQGEVLGVTIFKMLCISEIIMRSSKK